MAVQDEPVLRECVCKLGSQRYQLLEQRVGTQATLGFCLLSVPNHSIQVVALVGLAI